MSAQLFIPCTHVLTASHAGAMGAAFATVTAISCCRARRHVTLGPAEASKPVSEESSRSDTAVELASAAFGCFSCLCLCEEPLVAGGTMLTQEQSGPSWYPVAARMWRRLPRPMKGSHEVDRPLRTPWTLPVWASWARPACRCDSPTSVSRPGPHTVRSGSLDLGRGT